MNKRETRAETTRIIKETAEKLMKNINEEYEISKTFLYMAQDQLIATFTEQQEYLFERYVYAKERFDNALANMKELMQKP